MTRLAIRGYGSGVLRFEERLDVEDGEIDTLVPELAEKHALALIEYESHMIEIEFLEDPANERFVRFGTDPSMRNGLNGNGHHG